MDSLVVPPSLRIRAMMDRFAAREHARLVLLGFGLIFGCATTSESSQTETTTPSERSATVSPGSPRVVSTECPVDAARRWASVSAADLQLPAQMTLTWPDGPEEADLRACMILSVDARPVLVLAAFALVDEVWSPHAIVAMFDDSSAIAARSILSDRAESASCAAALGFVHVPAIADLALDFIPGIDTPFVRVEVVTDACGVACGSVVRDVALFAMAGQSLESAFRCRASEEHYVVSNALAEQFQCGGDGVATTSRYEPRAIRTCQNNGGGEHETCELQTWDGDRFVPASP